MENYVKLDITDGIGTVEFFTKQSNSLPGATLKELAETITEAGKNPEVKVIILKSGGNRTFCAGASFDELLAIEDPIKGKEFFMGFARVINAMRKAPKFIIGRVQGKAVGGGIGLASSTDYCFATQYASIKLSELALGIGPFVVSPAIERKTSLAAVSQMGITPSEFYSPEWVKEKGMFQEVFETPEEMDSAITELANKLKTYNPAAMAELKKVFWSGTDHWDELLEERAQISGNLVLSEFTKNFIKKFKEKQG